MASFDRKSYSGIAALTTLDGSINDTIETFALLDETGWPDGSAGDFWAQIEDEVILCDTRTATTVTVKTGGRGACGTSAVAHASGVETAHVFTSADADEGNYTTSKTVGKATAAGQILISDAANSFAALDVKTSGRILVGNGTTGVSVAVSGDASLAASGALTIAGEAVTTGKVADDAVTYAKIQNVSATDRLLGRDTAAAGNIEELTVGGGLEFTGSGGIQRSALTGDVTAAAGSGATEIAADAVGTAEIAALAVGTAELATDAVTTAKITDANVTAAKLEALLGRGKIGYTEVTGNQTGINTQVDLSLEAAVTVRAGSRIKITGVIFGDSTTSAVFWELYIMEGGTQLQKASAALGQASWPGTVIAQVILAPSTGAHTYKLQGATGTAGGRLLASATQPAYILVEDIGT